MKTPTTVGACPYCTGGHFRHKETPGQAPGAGALW